MLRQLSFQFVPLHERWQTKRLKRCSASLFQLTTSRGGRRRKSSDWIGENVISTHDLGAERMLRGEYFISTHDLTRRSTILDAGAEVLKIFQLTTSWGGRSSFRNFKCKVPGISTHDLAKRSTPAADESVQMPKLFQLTTSQGDRPEWRLGKIGKSSLSTHDLARRSTLAIVRDEQVCYYFNSRPHEEVDLCTAKYRC